MEDIKEVNLVELRQELQFTQKDVSDKMNGLSQGNISRFERSHYEPMIPTLRRYVEALGGELELLARFPDGRVFRLKV